MKSLLFKQKFILINILFLTLLAVSFSWLIVKASVINVDTADSGCVTDSGQIDPTAVVYCSIQDAIDDALPGDTINVASGTYSELITIDKSLTLSGDPGVCALGPGVSAPVLDGAGIVGSAITISGGVTNVTIEGFEITNYRNRLLGDPFTTGGIGSGVLAWDAAPINDITVRCNNMHDLGWNAVLVGNEGQALHNNWLVEHNIVTNSAFYGIELTNTSNSAVLNNEISGGTNVLDSGDDSQDAILIQTQIHTGPGLTNTNIIVENNDIDPLTRAGIELLAWDSTGVLTANLHNVTVFNNSVKDSERGVYIFSVGENANIDEVDIIDNTLDSNADGIQIRDALGGTHGSIDIFDNDIINSTGPSSGIRVRSVTSAAGIVINNNNIIGNALLGVNNEGTGILNAENNFWGACDGPGPVGPGSGDNVSANVDFTPWTGCTAEISGMKFEDIDFNGIKDGGEPGLEDWKILAGEKVNDFSVSSDGTVETSSILESGETYLIRASGTFDPGAGISADAQYSSQGGGWTDEVTGYESYGPELLDLQIDSTSPDWGVYEPSHVYWLEVVGTGTALDFQIYDIYYPNNTGALDVKIFKIVDETLTDVNGEYSLLLGNLASDEVVVFEELKTGWLQTYPTDGYYVLPVDIHEDIDFGNFKLGEIRGIKYDDLDGDGERFIDTDGEEPDETEPVIQGWKIKLKNLGTGIVTSTTTNEFGEFLFENVAPGDYKLFEKKKDGWVQTSLPKKYNITIDGSGEALDGYEFGNFKLGEIHGIKYEDMDGDGRFDNGEPVKKNWRITLRNADGNIVDWMKTDADGNYSFTDLSKGLYTLEEKMKNKWFQSEPGDLFGNIYTIVINESGQVEEDVNFGNYRKGLIKGRKYQDLNFNGKRNAGEPWLGGWTIKLINLRTGEIKARVTDGLGRYKFKKLVPGPYIVIETLQSSWLPVNPKSTSYKVDLQSGQKIKKLHFGNNTIVNFIAHKFLGLGNEGQPLILGDEAVQLEDQGDNIIPLDQDNQTDLDLDLPQVIDPPAIEAPELPKLPDVKEILNNARGKVNKFLGRRR